MRSAVAALLAVATVGCFAGGKPIELGTFLVTASRKESCADEGLIGMPAEGVYVVVLSRIAERTLHWREATVGLLVGELGYDNGFTFDQYIRAEMRPPDSDKPKCHIERYLDLSGTLEGEGPASFTGLTGKLVYRFEASAGSSCDDLLSGDDAIAAQLPCTIEMALDGEPE